MKQTGLWLLFLLFISSKVMGQNDQLPFQINMDKIVESLAEEMEDDVDLSELYEMVDELIQSPIYINQADIDDLKRMFFLNSFQVQSIVYYLEKYGAILSYNELLFIDGIDQITAQNILPFIDLSTEAPQVGFKNTMRFGDHQILLRTKLVLEQQQGFIEQCDSVEDGKLCPYYVGSRPYLYTRYRFRYRDLMSFGVTAEKDSGEEFFKGSQKRGYDFYSAHFFIKPKKTLYALAIGDYHAQFGQGLNMWSGLAFGKSSDIFSVKKKNAGLRPFASVDENRFLRGAAATLHFKNVFFTAFGSYKNVDSNSEFLDSLESEQVVSSIQSSGLHNTASLLEDRKSLTELIWGGNVRWQKKSLEVGATFKQLQYGQEVTPSGSSYKKFGFSGNSTYNTGMDINYFTKKWNLYGEWSINENTKAAAVAGLSYIPLPGFSISTHYRYYDKAFYSLYSNPLMINSQAGNEQGLYTGLEYQFNSKWMLSGYVDFFSFPWLKFGIDAPSRGRDLLLEATYKFNHQTRLDFKYRYKTKLITENDEFGTENIVAQEKQNFRIHLSTPLNSSIDFRSRVEFNNINEHLFGEETSFMTYTELVKRFDPLPLVISARYAYFNINSYDARMYTYERDLLYLFSIPALYGKGSKIYVLASYKMNRYLQFWLKYSVYWDLDKEFLSSGNNMIDGNRKSEIKGQIRIRI